jgi:Skp family chaperone for outer membrane proteins
MKTTERAILYTLLALLVAANFPAIVDGLSRPAHAAAALLERLGPVEAIALAGDDGAKEVVLKNRKGRLAWADDDYGAAYSVAFVHIGKVLNKLMQAAEFEEERRTLSEELSKQDEEYRSQLEALRKQAEGLDRESPDFKDVMDRGNRLFEEYQVWGREALKRRDKVQAEHLERSYRELVNAVEVVGDRKGIDMVYRFIPTSEAFESNDPESALNAIRFRTVVKYPESLDITADVLEELSLPLD